MFFDIHNYMEEEIIDEGKKSPLIYFITAFLLLLIVGWLIPRYAISPDPSPGKLPSLEEVRKLISNNSLIPLEKITIDVDNAKHVANFIATTGCPNGNKICYAKALYYFVRDNIAYINDPVSREFIQNPLSTIENGGGDCDDGSVLLASMLESIGIETEFVFIPNHVYVKAWLPEAARQYKTDGDWVQMEWTCTKCEFGEIPASNQ